MSSDRGTDKEDEVLITYIQWKLLSHQKNETVSFAGTCGPTQSLSCRGKSEREKQIFYINAHTWNLEKWYRLFYLQSRNRDTDITNKCMDTKGERGRDG